MIAFYRTKTRLAGGHLEYIAARIGQLCTPDRLAALPRHQRARLTQHLLAAILVLLVLGVSAVEHVGISAVPFVGGTPVAAGPGSSAGGEGNEAAAKGSATDHITVPPPSTGQASPPPTVGRTPPGVVVPNLRGALPVGKGMWIWLSERTENGDPAAIVARAKAVGLTHVYVRTASLKQGFYAGPFLDVLLPAAHAAGIRVYAWDFPYLNDVHGDVQRAVQAISYTTPDGHRVDGYSADIELRSMGVNVSPGTAALFGMTLRKAVGPSYPLIATVPRPSPQLLTYPYPEVVASFDAIAPMVYWMQRDPVIDVAGAVRDLAAFGKPILPVGQAYDALAEGGPAGVPPRHQLIAFMKTAEDLGLTGVSWWSWQHADQQAWDAIKDVAEFRLPAGLPGTFTPGQIRSYQTLLTSLGFPVQATGVWDAPTTSAVEAYQRAARLPVTGAIDEATRQILLTPVPPPITPM